MMVFVAFDTINTVVGGHDCKNICIQCTDIGIKNAA